MGRNEFGQLGLGDTIDRSSPVRVTEEVHAIAAGRDHSLILKANSGALPFELTISESPSVGAFLSWKDLFLDEMAFTVERSIENLQNFRQIVVTGADTVSFLDVESVQFDSKFYRVEALFINESN